MATPDMVRWRIPLTVAVYALFTTLMVWPIFSYRDIATASYPGDPRLNIWTLAWVHHWMSGGSSALFDSNIFFPAKRTLALSEPMLGIAVFTWPVYWASKSPVLSYNAAWWLSYLACALSAHWMVFRYTRDHVAALFGGCAYAFSFFRMLHGHAHLPLLWSFWIPLSVIATESWLESPSWGRVLRIGCCLILQTLGSWYLGVMNVIAVAVIAGTWALCRGRTFLTTVRLSHVLICGAVVGLCVWAAALPHLGLLHTNPGESARLSATWRSYLLPPQDTWLSRPFGLLGFRNLYWSFGEQAMFLGYTNLLLAFLGYWATWRKSKHRLTLGAFGVLCAVGLLLSFGPSAKELSSDWTAYGIFARIPGASFFRAPARFGLLVTLALAVAVSFGVSAIRGTGGRWLQRTLPVLLILSLSETYLLRFPLGPPRPEPIPDVYRQLASTGANEAVVSLPSFRGTDQWWREADYQYYSTANWKPLVNGYSRSEPDDHFWIVGHMMAFAGPNSAKTMRNLGVRWVVLHADRYPDRGLAVIEEAKNSTDFRLIRQDGELYVYEVLHPPATPP